MRNTNYYTDKFLREFRKEFKIEDDSSKRGEKKENMKNKIMDKKKDDPYFFSDDVISDINDIELERGNEIDKKVKDITMLKEYLRNYKKEIIDQFCLDNLTRKEIKDMIFYLIDIISVPQKRGRRGVIKTRPVIFERVYSEFRKRKSKEPFDCEKIYDDIFLKYRIGAIFEIYNRATYAIDDFIDDSDFRGEMPTMHKRFSAKHAILTGQYLHILSLEMLIAELERTGLDIGKKRCVIRDFNEIHNSIYRGENDNIHLQEKITEDDFLSEYISRPFEEQKDYYMKRAERRCGIFYKNIVKIAMIFAGKDIKEAEDFSRFGLLLGLRYMLDNDLKDLIDPFYIKKGTGSKGLKGKENISFCGDIEIGKITYPMLYSFKESDDEYIISLVGKKLDFEEKSRITSFIIENRGVSMTMRLMDKLSLESEMILVKYKVENKSLHDLTKLHKFSSLPFISFAKEQGIKLNCHGHKNEKNTK